MENICKGCGAIVKHGSYCLFCGLAVDVKPLFSPRRNVTAKLSFPLEEGTFNEKIIKEVILDKLLSQILSEIDFNEINNSFKLKTNECRFELTMEYRLF